MTILRTLNQKICAIVGCQSPVATVGASECLAHMLSESLCKPYKTEDELRKESKGEGTQIGEHYFPQAYGNCLNCDLSWRETVGTESIPGKPCKVSA